MPKVSRRYSEAGGAQQRQSLDLGEIHHLAAVGGDGLGAEDLVAVRAGGQELCPTFEYPGLRFMIKDPPGDYSIAASRAI